MPQFGLLGSLDDPSIVGLLRTALQSDPSEIGPHHSRRFPHAFQGRERPPLSSRRWSTLIFVFVCAASVSFNRMDYGTAKPLIVKALQSRDPLTRSSAYQVIGQNQDSSVASEVIAAVGREQDLYAKAQGLWTIGRIVGPRVFLNSWICSPQKEERCGTPLRRLWSSSVIVCYSKKGGNSGRGCSALYARQAA